ncbi:hypothetical protein [Streptomyces sp. Root1310]|uniref:hypothetical protein n=1 Tax=Streptomyces sp. Root1310 TaxID=1736452 RepID=UPI00070EACC8|nr:hypothetical protein [Streptomyces sp. Root1310]KQX61453.1 hypothetical protein ASD48_29845 [Streptomyces sp. Root1310]
MSENASATELTSQYTAQVTADLERNTKEQDRVGAEIAALQEQLASLQRDHTVLVNIQQAIDAVPATDTTAPPSGNVPVPAPRKKAAPSGTAKRTRPSRKTAAQPARPTGKTAGKTAGKSAGKPGAGKADVAPTAQTAQTTLVDLVRRHLTEQSEPRSAAEIATALGQAHPERGVKTTVVRTTLEGLVAKAQAQRSKQGSSVFYTAAEPSGSAATAPSEEQPAPADA